MKLPKKTQDALAAAGRRKAPPAPGGGAAGRAHQFALERGIESTPPKPAGRKVAKKRSTKVASKPRSR
jgi:hypothetical protein